MGGGGAALQPDLVGKIDDALPKGAPSTGYGLTETHGIVTANSAKLYLSQARVVRVDRARPSMPSSSTTRATTCRCRPTPSASCACAGRS